MAVRPENLVNDDSYLSKKELKLLQSFQYDKPSLRKSTLKISQAGNFYENYFKNSWNDPYNMSSSKAKLTKKKRSRGSITHKSTSSSTPIYIQIPLTDDLDNPIELDSNENNEEKLKMVSESDIQEKQTSQGGEEIHFPEKIERNYPLEISQFIQEKEKNLPISKIIKNQTYINCDLRYFNFDLLTERIGSFDVILCDPPWRIKGGQKNDSSFMFSNSKFNLEYNTLSNHEILSMKVEKLSVKGFCFLWVLNSLLDFGFQCLNKWGYDVVDQIVWVKKKGDSIYFSQGYYFLHSYEICLVGYKCPPGSHVDYKSKASSNVIISEMNQKSKKPEEIYTLIEKMLPGSKKIELFARNHNLRDGWFSLGNQLGDNFQHWKNQVTCDNCKEEIEIGVKRYKSKLKGNYDLCHKCFLCLFGNESNIINSHTKRDFFEIENNISDEIHHDYFSCNICQSEPIYGLRFSCKECANFDLCEGCYDQILENHTHDTSHEFSIHAIPEQTNGLPVHLECRCKYCFQKPIIGPCFECLDCRTFFLCQNCYFNSDYEDELHFGKNCTHKLTVRIKQKVTVQKYVKCYGCHKEPIEKIRYKCDQCFDFNLCEDCYNNKMNLELFGNSHKNYHTFSCLYL